MKSRSEKLWLQRVKSIQDDQILTVMIQKYGLKRWKIISEELKNVHSIFRTPKQCRDRWFNNLKIVEKGELSCEEVTLLFNLFDQYGAKWSMFSNILKKKTENQLKNFVNATIRRNVRRFNNLKPYHEKLHSTSLSLLKIPEVRNILLVPKNTPLSWFSTQYVSEECKRKILEIGIEEKIYPYQKISPVNETENGYLEELYYYNTTNFQENGSFLDLDLLLDNI